LTVTWWSNRGWLLSVAAADVIGDVIWRRRASQRRRTTSPAWRHHVVTVRHAG